MPEQSPHLRPSYEQLEFCLSRAEKLLDRWLDLYEVALEDARPDPNKITELVNVFTIIRRILEIRQLQKKVMDGDANREQAAGIQFDPELFGEGISGAPSES